MSMILQVFGIAAALARQGQLPMVQSKDSTSSVGSSSLHLFEDREMEDYFMSTYDKLRYVFYSKLSLTNLECGRI